MKVVSLRHSLPLVSAIALAAGLAACSSSEKPSWRPIVRHPSGTSQPVTPTTKPKPGVPAASINPYLWRAALESVSFMPLTTADSQGGVIITDWYSAAGAPNERAKLTILIVGKALQAESLNISMFKQARSGPNAEWQNVAITPGTEKQLADAVLTKARTLRVKATVPPAR